jgi:2-isopropylmalate synthase
VVLVIKKPIPDNLSVVVGNAFSHSAEIYQYGVLQNRTTYEIMKPEEVGWQDESLFFGKTFRPACLGQSVGKIRL